ncbi:MAG: hypothetical protein RL172_879 [Bacteroidota bacterium]|jgi:hypothetical protein
MYNKKNLLSLAFALAIMSSCKKSGSGNDNNNGGGNGGGANTDTVYNPVDPQITASQGFFLEDWQPRSFITPGFKLTSMPFDLVTDSVNVDLNKVITKVPKYIFGNNVNPYMTQIVDQPVLLGHINNLRPNVIRFPGGNISSVYFWDADRNTVPADVADTLYDSNKNPYPASPGEPHYTYWVGKNNEGWTLSLESYYSMMQTTGSTGIITVNYPYARYGRGANPVATAAHYAANWVRYDKGRTKFWEIGNEVSGPWQAGFKINTRQNKDGQPEIINGDIYGKHFKIFCDSMRAAAAEVGATIKIGAIIEALDASNSWNVVSRTWNAEFYKAAGNYPDFFIVHDYFQNAGNSVGSILASAAYNTKETLDYITANTAANGVNMKPIALTEWNIWNSGSKQMVSNIAGMHATLALGEMLNHKFGLANRWDFANGWNNGDDHGLFNNGTSNPAEPAWNPRPAFFHMYYFQKCVGDRLVQSTIKPITAGGDLVSYASTFTSGQAAVALVNKGADNRIVAVKFKQLTPGSKFYWYTLTGGSDNGDFSQKVFVNGTGPTGVAGGPGDYAGLKANASALSTNSLSVTVPARSVVFLVAERK